MTCLATTLLTALVLLFAAAPAVALACEQGTGQDDSNATLDQGGFALRGGVSGGGV